MSDRIRLGGIGLALPEGVLDRAASLDVANALTPAEVPRAVLERLHDRIGIDRVQSRAGDKVDCTGPLPNLT